MASKPSYLTIRQAAQRLGVHESTVRRYADRGLIGAVRLPSGVRRLRGHDVEVLARAFGEAAGNGPPTKTIEVLAAEQGVLPPSNLESLAAPDLWGSDEEADLFVAMTRTERDRDR
jgi:excisionase family DNA binding protein